jgi:hypothetical protein
VTLEFASRVFLALAALALLALIRMGWREFRLQHEKGGRLVTVIAIMGLAAVLVGVIYELFAQY